MFEVTEAVKRLKLLNAIPWLELLLSGTEKVPQRNCVTKVYAERSGELCGAICLRTLVLPAASAQNSSEPSLVLFERFFGFVGSFLGTAVSRVLFQKTELS